MSKISEGYYNLAAREKHTILQLMSDHPELSKKEMAEMLGITPSCLASKQKQWGVFKKDKRGRPKVSVDVSGTRIEGTIVCDLTEEKIATAMEELKERVAETSPVTMTEVPVFQTGVNHEGEE